MGFEHVGTGLEETRDKANSEINHAFNPLFTGEQGTLFLSFFFIG